MVPRPHLHLVPASHEGDPPAESGGTRGNAPLDLEEAFRSYAPLVAALAFRILGSRDQTEDLVQDVFVKAHDWKGRLHNPAALKSWLTTVTVREARLRLRLRRLRTFLAPRDTFDYETVAGGEASPAQRALTAEVYAILDRMPIEARLAWTLRHVEGLTLPEVARFCECSLATVKRRVTSAQETILKALNDE